MRRLKTLLAVAVLAGGSLSATLLYFKSSTLPTNIPVAIPLKSDENAYTLMKSFKCVRDDADNVLQLSWRSDTAESRHPGAFEGGGDDITLLFMPISDVSRDKPSTVSITNNTNLVIQVGPETLPITYFSVNVWKDREKISRPPNAVELSALKVDVERHIEDCLRGTSEEVILKK